MSVSPERPSVAARKGRIEELDAIRGIAALVVVLFHLTRRFFEDYGQPPNALPAFPIEGMHGVFLFFIVSGFVISITLRRTARPRDFIVSRLSRIYPAFWVSCAITFAVVSAFGLPGREVGFGAFLVNLTLLQDYFRVPQVDFVYWSLTMEISFYFLAYVVHSLGWLSNHPHRVVLVWLGWSTAFLFARDVFTLPVQVELLTLPRFAPLFCAGILFSLVREGRARWFTHVAIGCCLLLHNGLNWYGKTGVVLSTGMFVTFYLLVMGRLGFLAVRPLLFLGTISYPLYLVHANVGIVVIRTLLLYGFTYNVALLVSVTAVFGLAALITFTVERPAMRWLRGRFAVAPARA